MKRKRLTSIAALLLALSCLLTCGAGAVQPGESVFVQERSDLHVTMAQTETVAVGGIVTLTAQLDALSDGDAYQITIGTPLWESTDTTIATVSGSGLSAVVTGVSAGMAEIWITVPLSGVQRMDEEDNLLETEEPVTPPELTFSCLVTVTGGEETPPPEDKAEDSEPQDPETLTFPAISMRGAAETTVGGSCSVDVSLAEGWSYEEGSWWADSGGTPVWFTPGDVGWAIQSSGAAALGREGYYDSGFGISVSGLSQGQAVVVMAISLHYGNSIEGSKTAQVGGTCLVTVTGGTYTVTATAKPGGTITPAGNTTVQSGGSQTLRITPAEGYTLDYITVNADRWTSFAADETGGVSLTLSDIQENKEVVAWFKALEKAVTYTVAVTAGTGGTATPSGSVTVEEGDSLTVQATADDGWRIGSVLLDGVEQRPQAEKDALTKTTVTLTNLAADHTLEVFFQKKSGLSNPFTGLNVADFENPYSDVSEDDWFYKYLALMTMSGLLDGIDLDKSDDTKTPEDNAEVPEEDAQTPPASIAAQLLSAESKLRDKDTSKQKRACPDANQTRGDTVHTVNNSAGNLNLSDGSYTVNPFTDVASGASFYHAVLWASDKGIVNGYGGGLFGPFDSITREQMCAILLRAANQAGFTLPAGNAAVAFTDSASISTWAYDAVTACQRAGVINGYTDGSFQPQSKIIQSEFWAMYSRFVGLLP